MPKLRKYKRPKAETKKKAPPAAKKPPPAAKKPPPPAKEPTDTNWGKPAAIRNPYEKKTPPKVATATNEESPSEKAMKVRADLPLHFEIGIGSSPLIQQQDLRFSYAIPKLGKNPSPEAYGLACEDIFVERIPGLTKFESSIQNKKHKASSIDARHRLFYTEVKYCARDNIFNKNTLVIKTSHGQLSRVFAKAGDFLVITGKPGNRKGYHDAYGWKVPASLLISMRTKEQVEKGIGMRDDDVIYYE